MDQKQHYQQLAQAARSAGEHIHHFHGGLRLRHNKKISCQDKVERPPLPKILTVPLLQHSGPTANPVVAIGERVKKGQLIGRCGDREEENQTILGARIHAPTSGTVIAVDDRPITHPSGLEGLAVVIEADGEDQWLDRSEVKDWQNLKAEQLLNLIHEAGIVGLGGAVFPTARKVQGGHKQQVHTLILNGAECEPYISCDEMLMREQPEKVIQGAMILQKTLGAERTVIGIEDQMGAVQRALEQAVEDLGASDVSVVKVTTIYPEGGERQLIQVLTGLEVPADGLPADMGLVCINVGTAAACSEAVLEGKALIERIVTVTGNGIQHPRNLLALFGTPIEHLVEQCGGYTGDVARLILGGPMMGYALPSDGLPMIKAANCILALTHSDIGTPQPEMPCIRCAECARVCPAQLLPQQLHFHIRNNQWAEVEEHQLKSCIECGCCDFVCPSHIPLTNWFRYGKSELRTQTVEKQKADLARQRHEARDERLLRIKQEKAQRLAQKKQALKDQAEKKQKIAAAIERAKNKRDHKQNADSHTEAED